MGPIPLIPEDLISENLLLTNRSNWFTNHEREELRIAAAPIEIGSLKKNADRKMC